MMLPLSPDLFEGKVNQIGLFVYFFQLLTSLTVEIQDGGHTLIIAVS